jgi:hypothetical protein
MSSTTIVALATAIIIIVVDVLGAACIVVGGRRRTEIIVIVAKTTQRGLHGRALKDVYFARTRWPSMSSSGLGRRRGWRSSIRLFVVSIVIRRRCERCK